MHRAMGPHPTSSNKYNNGHWTPGGDRYTPLEFVSGDDYQSGDYEMKRSGQVPLVSSFGRTSSVPAHDGMHTQDDSESLIFRNGGANAKYNFSRYIPRAVLNSLGPILVLVLYLFIVIKYLARPASNGVVPPRSLDANIVFYSWWLINIFVLDWAKSGIAGFEAAALGHPKTAPKNARQLMWHTDQAWGSLTGWARALKVSGRYVLHKVMRRPTVWIGPSLLWFYLAISSLMLYVAIPLSGLSMNQATALSMRDRIISVHGVNQSTFDSRTTNTLAETVGAIWRQGHTTTPRGATVLYAPSDTQNASNTYYDDQIQLTYERLLNNTSNSLNETVTTFSGPEVSERAYGRAWGFLSTVSCSIVPVHGGLTLLNVTSVNNWTSVSGLSSNITNILGDTSWYGSYPVYTETIETLGASYAYVMASDSELYGIGSAFVNASELPGVGITELVMWQSYNTEHGNFGDQEFTDLQDHPMVVSSKSASDNLTYYGFAVRCVSVADVGRATLSTTTYTFSDFESAPASRVPGLHVGQNSLTQYPMIMPMHTIAFCAATNVFVGLVSMPDVVHCEAGLSNTCGFWSSANAATYAVPMINKVWKSYQQPTISPERMVLALYKLFGEVAIAMMGTGPEDWTTVGDVDGAALYGLDLTNDLVPGVVPYRAVIIFLALWVVITVIPQLWPPFFVGRRWGATLDGFSMFRLGAEWQGAVHKLTGVKLEVESHAESLADVPGMIGDMKDSGVGTLGFVGLSSRQAANDRRKNYTYTRY